MTQSASKTGFDASIQCAMNEDILESRRFANIFLCTQSNDITRWFQKRYQDKTISHLFKNNSRGSKDVHRALIDIKLPSKWNLTLGPQSAFNFAASLFENKSLLQIPKPSAATRDAMYPEHLS